MGTSQQEGGRAGHNLLQTPRPLLRIRVYLRTCFLKLPCPSQDKPKPCQSLASLGGHDCLQQWPCHSKTQDVRHLLDCLLLSAGGSGRGVAPSPSSLWAVILSPVRALLECPIYPNCTAKICGFRKK